MIANINNLIVYRELILAWTLRSIRARYQQSLLGVLWAIIQPAASAVIFTIIFTKFVPVDTGDVPYIVFSYTAMAPWMFFTSSVNEMVASLVTNINLVIKIYFPREVLPIAVLFSRLMDFAIAYILLGVLMIVYRRTIYIPNLIYIPLILIVQMSLSLGLGLIGSALNVFYRDIRHIFSLILNIWFYASPIIYPVTAVPENLRKIYYLNPMVGILESYRAVIIYNHQPSPELLISAFSALSILFIGYWFFKRVEFQFADVV